MRTIHLLFRDWVNLRIQNMKNMASLQLLKVGTLGLMDPGPDLDLWVTYMKKH